MHTGGGGRGGRGDTSCTPYKDFWKLPHKNEIKTTPPPIFSQPQVPPSKEFAKNPQGPPSPPPWISNYWASMYLGFSTVETNQIQTVLRQSRKSRQVSKTDLETSWSSKIGFWNLSRFSGLSKHSLFLSRSRFLKSRFFDRDSLSKVCFSN
jgi:hypothetical protein